MGAWMSIIGLLDRTDLAQLPQEIRRVTVAVSYTHRDVYKRQVSNIVMNEAPEK